MNTGLEIFQPIKTEILLFADKCATIVVNSDTIDMAKSLVKDAQKIEKLIEEKRVETKKPFLEKEREIDARAKELAGDLTSAIKGLREQIRSYEIEKERIRQEELRKVQEEQARFETERRKAEEERAKLEAEAKANGTPLPDIPAVPVVSDVSELDLRMREKELEQSKSKSLRTAWDYKIVDESLIPRMYMIPDEKKLRAAIKSGLREIPGLKIYEDPNLVLR
ncbi:MAG: hypothetical protein MUE91_07305 [Ignavibacteriaceae bacterium]|jgi:DNA repair exonuclease SbcCD ATPase subunit|nr:hypothetical protein [Ignavibacteriaceae bacterium]